MFTIRLLGGASLEGPAGAVTGRAGLRQRIALLAMLAVDHPRPLSRDRLIAHIWPESDTANARHLLSESLYILRSATADNLVIGVGDSLRLDPAALACDLWELEDAYARDELDQATDLYRGPFLSGFHLPNGEEFERWVDGERERLTRRHLQTLEKLAERHLAGGDAVRAAAWWSRVALEDPFNSRIALRYMQALESAGDRAAAIRHASAHSELLRAELDATPDGAVLALADRLKRESRSVAHSAPAVQPAAITTAVDRTSSGNSAPGAGPPAEALDLRMPARSGPPRRHWAAAMGGAGIVVVLGVLGGALSRARSAPLAPRRVATAPFENRTGRKDLDDLGALAADRMLRGIYETPQLDLTGVEAVYARSEGDGTHNADPMAAARRERAAILVQGTYYRSGDSVLFQAQAMDVASGRLLRAFDPVGAPVDRATDALARLQERVATGVSPLIYALDRGNPVDPDLTPPPSLAAYREFVAGINLVSLDEWAAEAQHYHEAARIDSTFVAPLVQLAFGAAGHDECGVTDSIARLLAPRRARLSQWDRMTVDAMRSYCYGDIAELLHQLQLRYAAYPHSASARVHYARALSRTNQPRAAQAILGRLDPEHDFGWHYSAHDVWPRYWWLMAGTWHVLGGYEKELEITERWIDSAAVEWRLVRARAFAALGRDGEVLALTNGMTGDDMAEQRLTMAAELAAHGHQATAMVIAESVLARLDATTSTRQNRAEYAASANRLLGRRGAERGALEAVARSDADTLTKLEAKGRLAVLRADTGGAERIDRALAEESERPLQNPKVRASLIVARAHIAAGFGRRERAVTLLAAAQARGEVDDGSSFAYHTDPLLAPLRGYQPFEALLRPAN